MARQSFFLNEPASLIRFNLRHILPLSAIDTLFETGSGRGKSLAWAVQARFREPYSVPCAGVAGEVGGVEGGLKAILHSGNILLQCNI